MKTAVRQAVSTTSSNPARSKQLIERRWLLLGGSWYGSLRRCGRVFCVSIRLLRNQWDADLPDYHDQANQVNQRSISMKIL
jgi:hypothetical protein